MLDFLAGVGASLVAMAIWVYGSKKRKGYYQSKIDSLEHEKSRIEAIAKKPSELHRDAFNNIFYLVFVISLANIIRLFHGLLYDDGVVWQHFFTEGGLWLVIGSLAIRFKKRIESTYAAGDSLKALDKQIADLREKCSPPRE